MSSTSSLPDLDLEERSRAESPSDTCAEDMRHEKFDPCQLLERSQSDASLTKTKSQTSKRMMSYTKTQKTSNSAEQLEKLETTNKVSESSRVYFDLSQIDTMIENETSSSSSFTHTDSRSKLILGQSLETIPQGEELSLSHSTSHCLYSASNETESEASELDSEDYEDLSSFYRKYPIVIPSVLSSDSHLSYHYKNNLKLTYQQFGQRLETHITPLKSASAAEEISHLGKILGILKEAWSVAVYGRDLAYGLCDVLRLEGVLDLIIKNCGSSNQDLMMASAALLEQSLSTKNRERVVKTGLETVIGMTYREIGNTDMAFINTGILEGLFKVSEEASTKIVSLGGLDVILHWCRSCTIDILRHCAKAISNLSLFGGMENQEEMARRNVPEWLFPLAFNEDNNVRYYACLAIVVLVANKELEAAVIKSGTLELVMPFISSNKPADFAKSDFSHQQGRDNMWLERLVPILSSHREEPQALAAFHFAMEAGIKAEQGRLGVFYDIDAIEPLKKVASSPNAKASRLAAQALKIIGEVVPHKLTQQVPIWSPSDVSHWVTQIGFKAYASKFQSCQVDGDLLLLLTEQELDESIGIKCRLARKRFLRELLNLKITADYSSLDRTQMDSWLTRLQPELSQYTYYMLKQGMTRDLLGLTTDQELLNVCHVTNGIHRRLILEHAEDLYNCQIQLPKYGSIGSLNRQKSVDVTSLMAYPKAVDVFISYRRSNGSQLASLLKVHLQLRGFTVFIDIERLRAGKFDENLLMNIKLARHFLLVLTPDALDRCKGDDEQQDWIHKEIVTALESDCNIIPVLDNFEWPVPEELPTDMQQVVYFNGVRWVHDYQDACVDKVEKFLSGEITPLQKFPVPVSQGSLKATSPDKPFRSSGEKSFHSPGEKSFHSPGEKSFHSPGEKSFHSPGEKLFHTPGEKSFHSPGEKSFHSPAEKSFHSPGEKSLPVLREENLNPDEAEKLLKITNNNNTSDSIPSLP
ncbi:sterile alpha and TIR motif-containing protein 1-like isoform X1 [Pecten maximus]|uniref:sterile alpha and TIR motif-containing protein 1-like isoform X1 n=1 Tax=Pecten maximus TaxID=6579 RepID=UPI0014586F8D|nr:sterile alpha and TIR motif-containing protein 1-like isoform X1 [Pecten maximus]XP_033747199.1 sterile alpha and TIR motif-containing protein 1-like isoform X1 [Pecten maximus]XP_033747201.1 sterile alpha and TIR motif-containing protein 1-like isoform X1 [Pecten maximus]XP_033747202.1 sterile alpha and TIR motif-containing protein 1-like isoform X1 [Pecten maximus]